MQCGALYLPHNSYLANSLIMFYDFVFSFNIIYSSVRKYDCPQRNIQPFVLFVHKLVWRRIDRQCRKPVLDLLRSLPIQICFLWLEATLDSYLE